MRLLFVTHSLPPLGLPMENIGGMQRVALDLHDSLNSRADIEVVSLVLRSRWRDRSYRTPVFLARALREIRQLARAREIDAILFTSMVTASVAIPLRRLLRASGIATAAIANGLDVTTPVWPYPSLVRKTFDAIDVTLPISSATAAACRSRGLPEHKSRVVPLGVRLDRFGNADREASRAKLIEAAFPNGTALPSRLVLSSVGRLVPRKGVAWFVSEVMPLLPPDVVFVVAGDGEDRRRVEAAITERNVSDRVRLLDEITDSQLETLYAGSDLFIMPNVTVDGDMEGFGLVMLEAGLSGVPTVASAIEGIADVITE
ncbi:MAG: glycosyltransferase family 4 protein, partial [Gemmatimonadaceae bacterium]